MVLAYLTLGSVIGLAAFLGAIVSGAGIVLALVLLSSTATAATLFSVVRKARCLDARAA